jgi:hypothetical protein
LSSGPSWELGSSLVLSPQEYREGVGMAHPTGVFATFPAPSTQHELCHLLGIRLLTYVVGHEVEVHTLESPWEQDCGPGTNMAAVMVPWPPPFLSQTWVSGIQAAWTCPGVPSCGWILPQPEAKRQLPSSGSSGGRSRTLTVSVMLAGSDRWRNIKSWLLSLCELGFLFFRRLLS